MFEHTADCPRDDITFPTAARPLKSGKRRFSVARGLFRSEQQDEGQVLVIGLIMAIALFMVSISVANVGMYIAEKMQLQDSVDAAAYSTAVTQARYMNLSAYINRAMVANYNSMAFNTAVWATLDADDHGLAVIIDMLYKVSEILGIIPFTIGIAQAIDSAADGLRAVHDVLHEVLSTFDMLFAQDEQDLNQYLEVYNIYALTLYQGFLYASLQADRHLIAQQVASRVDPDVRTTTTLGLATEAVNYDELAQAVDWVIRDTDARSGFFNAFNRSFNEMMGEAEDTSDHPLLLAAVTEASLDAFTAGRDRKGDPDLLRQFNSANMLPDIPLLDFELRIGASMRDGQEDRASDRHVPKIARRRMRQANFFGISFGFGTDNIFLEWIEAVLSSLGLPSSVGHTSGDYWADVANAVNGNLFLTGFNFDRALQCLLTGTGCQLSFSAPSSGYNAQNMKASMTMLPTPLLPGPPLFADDHWDGTGDVKPIHSHEFFDPVSGKLDPPQYLAQVISDGLEEGVPRYDWIVDLDNVGFPSYHYPNEDAHQRPSGNSRGGRIEGPSIAVIGIKPTSGIRTMRGMKIGVESPNDYPMTAIARSQVYYLRNPKRPDEKPSLFNPHWVARLAPIDDDDTPTFVREILPFVSGMGLPLDPTH